MKTDLNPSFVSPHVHPAHDAPVPVMPDVYGDDPAACADGAVVTREELHLMRSETATRLLLFISKDREASIKEAGRSLYLMLHYLKPECNQAALASQLGITPGRCSQLLNDQKSNIDQCFKQD
jgi:hypothetical protein